MAAFVPFLPAYTPEPRRCASGTQPGTRALQDYICDDSPWRAAATDLGTFVCRTIAGTSTLSAHASGRAGDSGFTVRVGGHPMGTELAAWLVANAALLGVQEVIWNRRRWDNRTRRWQKYNGKSPHLDHVHWAQNTSGARHCTEARILSVAPKPPAPPEEPFMPALTTAEQRELLTKVRQLEARSLQVVRRKGGQRIFLHGDGWLHEFAATEATPAVGKMLVALAQPAVRVLDTEVFDALTEPVEA